MLEHRFRCVLSGTRDAAKFMTCSMGSRFELAISAQDQVLGSHRQAPVWETAEDLCSAILGTGGGTWQGSHRSDLDAQSPDFLTSS